MHRPFRSPLEIPELVKPYITGKSFCEVGCGAGDLLKLFAKYAETAIGIEIREHHWDALKDLENTIPNIEIIYGDALNSLPCVDTYFVWTKPRIDQKVFLAAPGETTIISYKTLFNKPWLVDAYNEFPESKTEWIEFVSSELGIPYYNTKNLITDEVVKVTRDTPFVIGILHKKFWWDNSKSGFIREKGVIK